MIVFGYKNNFNSIFRSATSVLAGVLMVVLGTDALNLIVQIVATFMIVSGIFSLIVGLRNKGKETYVLLIYSTVINLLIGVLLFVFPEFVANLMFFIIGFVLLLFGILQIVSLFSARSVMVVSLAAFIIPVFITLAGGLILFTPFTKEIMVMFCGVILIVYGVSEIFTFFKIRQALKKEEGFSGAEYVDYEEVDEQ